MQLLYAATLGTISGAIAGSVPERKEVEIEAVGGLASVGILAVALPALKVLEVAFLAFSAAKPAFVCTTILGVAFPIGIFITAMAVSVIAAGVLTGKLA